MVLFHNLICLIVFIVQNGSLAVYCMPWPNNVYRFVKRAIQLIDEVILNVQISRNVWSIWLELRRRSILWL